MYIYIDLKYIFPIYILVLFPTGPRILCLLALCYITDSEENQLLQKDEIKCTLKRKCIYNNSNEQMRK